jgi:predicted RND superfamily exporter protein
MRSASVPGPRTRAFVDWTLRNGKWIWLAAVLLAVPATWRTVQLYAHLKSDLEELLPREAASVRALDELRARMPGLRYLGVVVDVGDGSRLPAGERLIDGLAARIRAYPPELVRAVRTGTQQERAFLEANAPLYVDLEDLQTIRARIEARRDYEVGRETGSALDDDAPPPALDFSDIEKRYEDRLPKGGRGEHDRYSSRDLHLTMLLVQLEGFESGTRLGREVLSRVQSDIAALMAADPRTSGMRVGYAGDVAISVEELDALVADLALSSVLVLCATIALIIYFYSWSRSVLVLVPPLLIAAVYAFALASLPPFRVTELNSNTAFLGSIILGNGINFGIILLSRYVEERRRGVETRDALVTAVYSARFGTLSAALGAGVAYGSLVSTQFRGFRQFGFIGGIGMLASWLVAFVCMPPLIAWLDRAGSATRTRHKETFITTALGRFLQRFPAPIVAVGVVLTILALTKAQSFSLDELESDFSKLRRADTWQKGEGYWGRRMDSLIGEYLTPTVLLASSPEQARAVAARVREEATGPALEGKVDKIRTLDDVLPPHQPEKIAEAAAIREDLTPKLRSLVAPDRRDALDRLLGNEDLRPITIDRLPRTFTVGLVERDGTAGRAVLVFPRWSPALWKGPPLAAFVGALREAATVGGSKPALVAGSLPLSADILASIERDGVMASALAFAGVLCVIVLMFRRQFATVYVVVSLCIGVLWLVAATMVLGVKINFANFIAFPITFGIGADYAMNVMARNVQAGKLDIFGTVRATGSAVALCSLTTIIGYSSLLLAENRALYLFGVVAVLGEVACLATAVTFLPAVLVLAARWSGAPIGRPPSAST